MKAQPKSTFANNVSPWTGQRVSVKPRVNPTKYVELDSLRVVDDPLPQRKRDPVYKYDALFGGLKPGQGVACKPEEVQRLQHAMTTWIKRKGLTATRRVRSIKNYNDTGEGRVWLLAKEE